MTARYRFGRCELRPATRQLLVEGKEAAIGARAFDVLVALAENRDRVVSKDELLDRVWPGMVVEENNLHVQISALRKLIGPRAIATVTGRGYQLTLAADDPAAPSCDEGSPPPAFDLLRLSSPRVRGDNLPEPSAPLVARESDVRSVTAMLTEYRIVSVVGAGGIGKTRLALEVARNLRGEPRDGVWWIELDSIRDARLIATTVARALGVDVGAVSDPRAALIRALASLQALLVLDNCEHLRADVALFVHDCLEASSRCRWLVTSQEPLKLAAERVYRLGTLAVPPIGSNAQTALQYGAVALLVDRVRAADQRWTLDDGDVGAAIAICDRLDGIALAIEMAAARVPLLGVAGVRDRLDERLRLLANVRGTEPGRQRTLRAALDWSHSLLTPIEQTAFRRMAVFAGGFTLDLAQQVVGARADDAVAPALDEWAVLDALGALVDKSLVIADAQRSPRYRMLESARIYALQRLAEAAEREQMTLRHALAMARFFTQAGETKWTQTEAQWLASVAPELENLRAAFDTAIAAGELDAAVALAAHSFTLSRDLGHYAEARQRLEAVRGWLPRAQPPVAATGYLALGDFGEALLQGRVEALHEAHDRFRALGDTRRRYVTAAVLGELLARSGRASEAAEALAEAEQLEDPSWPPRLRAVRCNAKAMLAEASGDVAEAKRAMRQAIALDRAAGWQSRVVAKMTNLAAIALAAGDIAEAIEIGTELVSSQASPQSVPGLAYMNLTGALILQDRLTEARATARTGLPLMQLKGQGYLFVDHLALLAAKERRHDDAARLVGWADARYAACRTQRDAEEAHARALAIAAVDAAIGMPTRESLMSAAATLDEDEVVVIAFTEPG
jgi:predicted ATPase/DNA-binding winged helix-turn-helix (wHTH) protein